MSETRLGAVESIISAANIEANQQMGGSHKQIPEHSMRMVPNKDPNKRYEVNALTFVSPLAYKLILHLDEEPVTKSMVQNLDQKLRVTKGLYMIKYIPRTDKRYRKGRPWCIGQDLIHMGIYVSGPREWNKLCDRIPELNWIRRNSGLSEELFYTARNYPGMSFWFCVDWVRYENMLRAKSEFGTGTGTKTHTVYKDELGPLGAYKCSGEEYRKHYKDKVATLRTLADVLKDVQEVEMLPAVQEEMMLETGEADITRKQYIKGMGGVNQPKDPTTGRFIKKDQNLKEE